MKFTEMSLNADRAGKLVLGFPTTCKDHPRTLGSHPHATQWNNHGRQGCQLESRHRARLLHLDCLTGRWPDFPQPVFTMVVLFAAAQEKKSHTFVLPGTGSISRTAQFHR